jgi:hypothetical protein
MRICTELNQIADIKIENETKDKGIVLLFPITRTGSSAIEVWFKLAETAIQSKVHALIVIDKTPESQAFEYFWNNANLLSSGINLYVLKRSIKESHYDSLGGIFLANNLWIIQIHDDDSWDGIIELPGDVHPDEIVLFSLFVSGFGSLPIDDLDISMPARILFSLIPSKLWNKFSALLLDQHRHTAGSSDSTLSTMASVSSDFRKWSSFNYYYDDRNWRDNKESTFHLSRLAEDDGWENWSSPQIAVINRAIDSLASLSYCIDSDSIFLVNQVADKIIKDLKPSKLRQVVYFFKMSINPSVYLLRTCNGLSLKKVVVKSWKISSITETILYIENFLEKGNLRLLNDRFVYWKDSLTNLKVSIIKFEGVHANVSE